MEYIELDESGITEEVLREFDCGNPDITEYLHYNAKQDSSEGKCVTYVLVDSDRKRVYAYATIAAHGLYYYDEAEKYHTISMTGDGKVLLSVPCVEIKMFAISRKLKGQVAYIMDSERKRHYSTLFFNMFLEKLYYMSMKIIGFQLVFLRANNEGERLYRKSGFVKTDEFLGSYDAKAEGCVSLMMPLSGVEDILFT